MCNWLILSLNYSFSRTRVLLISWLWRSSPFSWLVNSCCFNNLFMRSSLKNCLLMLSSDSSWIRIRHSSIVLSFWLTNRESVLFCCSVSEMRMSFLMVELLRTVRRCSSYIMILSCSFKVCCSWRSGLKLAIIEVSLLISPYAITRCIASVSFCSRVVFLCAIYAIS